MEYLWILQMKKILKRKEISWLSIHEWSILEFYHHGIFQVHIFTNFPCAILRDKSILTTLTRKNPVIYTIQQKHAMCVQLSSALFHLHQENIIHCDLSLRYSNFLLAKNILLFQIVEKLFDWLGQICSCYNWFWFVKVFSCIHNFVVPLFET